MLSYDYLRTLGYPGFSFHATKSDMHDYEYVEKLLEEHDEKLGNRCCEVVSLDVFPLVQSI